MNTSPPPATPYIMVAACLAPRWARLTKMLGGLLFRMYVGYHIGTRDFCHPKRFSPVLGELLERPTHVKAILACVGRRRAKDVYGARAQPPLLLAQRAGKERDCTLNGIGGCDECMPKARIHDQLVWMLMGS